jgi:hypothetical protein
MATNSSNQVTGWVGWVAFASFMMMLGGFFQAFEGLTAIVKDQFFVVTPSALISVDVSTWGWIHLLVGILLIFAGSAVMQGKIWGRTLGVLLALASAIVNLAFIPYYPIWSILIIVVDVLVVYALVVHGGELRE